MHARRAAITDGRARPSAIENTDEGRSMGEQDGGLSSDGGTAASQPEHRPMPYFPPPPTGLTMPFLSPELPVPAETPAGPMPAASSAAAAPPASAAPAAPVAPAEPSAPTEPADPATPTEPIAPAGPADRFTGTSGGSSPAAPQPPSHRPPGTATAPRSAGSGSEEAGAAPGATAVAVPRSRPATSPLPLTLAAPVAPIMPTPPDTAPEPAGTAEPAPAPEPAGPESADTPGPADTPEPAEGSALSGQAADDAGPDEDDQNEDDGDTAPDEPPVIEATEIVEGRIRIEDEVIEKIAVLAALEVHGVAALSGHPAGLQDTGGRGHRRARAIVQDNQVTIDLVIAVSYGSVVMDVARLVKTNVARVVSGMLGIRVCAVNVTIDDVRMPAGPAARPGTAQPGAVRPGIAHPGETPPVTTGGR